MQQRIVTNLWFDTEAEDAAELLRTRSSTTRGSS